MCVYYVYIILCITTNSYTTSRSLSLYIYVSLSLYMYIYIYMYMCIYIYIYVCVLAATRRTTHNAAFRTQVHIAASQRVAANRKTPQDALEARARNAQRRSRVATMRVVTCRAATQHVTSSGTISHHVVPQLSSTVGRLVKILFVFNDEQKMFTRKLLCCLRLSSKCFNTG